LRFFCWFILIPIVVGVGFILWGAHLERQISHGDNQAILLACRTMIAERQNYHNHRPDSNTRPGDPVWPSKDEIPAIIKNMHPEPKYIVIDKNHVLICFSALPRVYLVGYAEGAKQNGGRQLIDGLQLE
jgi:hypothetical protein